MVKIILCGCNGTMGRVISRCVGERYDCTVVAGIDPDTEMREGYHVFSAPDQCQVEADVAIDFSHPAALEPLLEMAEERKTGVVVATTGLSGDQIQRIRRAAETVPVFHSSNMSLGINLMLELAKTAARVLGRDFDIEIIEKHHNQKIDAPSGTALMLAEAVAGELPQPPHYVYDRHSQRKKRGQTEIGIHAIRGGTITGEHDILFAGRDELLTLRHTANSKEIFAVGAVNAALFLAGKPKGLYNMADLIDE